MDFLALFISLKWNTIRNRKKRNTPETITNDVNVLAAELTVEYKLLMVFSLFLLSGYYNYIYMYLKLCFGGFQLFYSSCCLCSESTCSRVEFRSVAMTPESQVISVLY